MYADYDEWYMISFSQVPLLASPCVFANPKQGQVPTNLLRENDFGFVCLKALQGKQHEHIWIIQLIFDFL